MIEPKRTTDSALPSPEHRENDGCGWEQAFTNLGKLSPPWFAWPVDAHVHVVTRTMLPADAVGNFSLAAAQLLRSHGLPCTVYANRFDPLLHRLVLPITELWSRVTGRDLLFYQYSIFDPWIEVAAVLPCRKVLFYQNITPHHFIQAYDVAYATKSCLNAPAQMAGVASRFDVLAANSRQTAAELRGQVMKSKPAVKPGEVLVCPPFIGVERYKHVRAQPIDFPAAATKLLHVGRLAPNKKIEDVIAVYAEYHQHDPDSILLLVGVDTFAGYRSMLNQIVGRLPENVRQRIHFLGKVSDGQLKTIYQQCSLFLTMTEHEGFCVPLVEAMIFDLPVAAFAEPAVQETLGSSGLIFRDKDFGAIAAAIHDIVACPHRRKELLAGQQRRLEEIAELANGQAIWQIIEKGIRARAD